MTQTPAIPPHLLELVSRIPPELVEQTLLERDLRKFVKEAWHVVEPSAQFVPNWHIDCICEHLMAVFPNRELRRLLINIPPGFMKSLLVSVFWPAFIWTTTPSFRWLALSGSLDIAVRDAMKARSLIESEWYQARWRDKFQIRSDQNQKLLYENDRTGFRNSTSIGAKVTGKRGDGILIDDPIDVEDANYDNAIEVVNRWLKESMPSRLNDQRTGFTVLIMQRIHEKDPSGMLMEEGGWHHVVLPARFEPRVQLTVGGGLEPQPHDDCSIYSDPRTKPGELLFPEMFPDEVLRDLEHRLGSYAASGQYQQRPVPREGALFKSEFFRPLPDGFSRDGLAVVQWWDLAFSEKKHADFTAAVTLAFDPKTQDMHIVHVFNEQVQHDTTADATLAELRAFLPTDVQDGTDRVSAAAKTALAAKMALTIMQQEATYVGVEDAAYRQSSVRDIVRLVQQILLKAGYYKARLRAVKVDKDKISRANLPAGRGAAGQLYADRKAPWYPAFEGQALKFPRAAHDDMIDSLAGACQLALESVRPPSKRRVRKLTFGR